MHIFNWCTYDSSPRFKYSRLRISRATRSPKRSIGGAEANACHAGAAAWSQALSDWLKVTEEDDVHVVTGSRDSNLAGRKFKFLIVSYNMVRSEP